MFGWILEQISECCCVDKKNSVTTVKMAVRNIKSSTPLKGANEPNPESFYDLWGFGRLRKFG
jgi:hypothetical protein